MNRVNTSVSHGSEHPIRVGVAGLGRSGWDIHCAAIDKLPGHFTITAVTDPDPARTQDAANRFSCRVHPNFDALLRDPQVDLVVVATPSKLHASNSITALESGKHVVCEKPFCNNSAEADRMIAAAERTGRVLAPFQNLRYAPNFLKVQEVIESGKLGRIVQIRLAVHSFGRRWDWQTLRAFGGGELRNTGPHFLDQLLQLIGPDEPEIFCHMDKALSSGDAEDHLKLVLRNPGQPLVELEISRACAYPQDLWLVMGTHGTLRGKASALEWKYVDFALLPERPVEPHPTPGRSYNSETLPFIEESWELTEEAPNYNTHTAFYRGLYRTLREQAPLAITPQSVRRQIQLIERCPQPVFAAMELATA